MSAGQHSPLPCPFCGGPALLYLDDRACCADEQCPGWTVDRCLVEKWNTRTPHPALPKCVAALEGARSVLEAYEGLYSTAKALDAMTAIDEALAAARQGEKPAQPERFVWEVIEDGEETGSFYGFDPKWPDNWKNFKLRKYRIVPVDAGEGEV